MTMDLRLIHSVPPWYSCAMPKPVYESSEALASWNVPVYADHTIFKANRVDARFVDHKNKKVWAVEMCCPWMEHQEKKSEKKTVKYGPLLKKQLELKRQFQGFQVKQFDILMDVLVGYSKELESTMRTLTGSRSKEVLLKMQKTVLSSSLSIARLFKVMI
ncbi:unnamed protein product [Porites lobata]|uniref:Uncharacterized protein n=1 Tax=Porites lobata TaxID=104759 RepID=A0ABN8PEK2_9CNID|nr:unnamed protein product [Porites lobata]